MTKSLGKLDDLLNRFQKAVDDGKYKRISYTQWKKLKTADKCKAKIVTDEITGSQFVQIIRKEDDKIVLEFDVEDQSFGEFLSTEILSGGTNMPPKDNQVYSWNSTVDYDNTIGSISYGKSFNSKLEHSNFDNVYNKATSTSLSDTFVTKDEFNAALASKEDKKPLNSEKK